MMAFSNRRRLFLSLTILAGLFPSNNSFSTGSSRRVRRVLSSPPVTPFRDSLIKEQSRVLASTRQASSNDIAGDDAFDNNQRLARFYTLAKLATCITWIVTAYVALSFHPDPRFKDCTLRHNLLTMSQAYAFPLPVIWSSLDALRVCAKNGKLDSPTAQRLGVGVGVASFWLAAHMAFPGKFAFGYDLYQQPHKVIAAIVHAITGLFAMGVVLRTNTLDGLFRGLVDSLWNLGPKKKSGSNEFEKNSSLLATGCVGLLWFAILPIVSQYPLATIPTILGKRLSRPASAFTLLGAVMAYCLKEGDDSSKSTRDSKVQTILGRGLAIGSASHLFLIALKLIGVDGGGWILPGRGLWEVYPAMMAVPFAAGVSMLVHAVVCYATFSLSSPFS